MLISRRDRAEPSMAVRIFISYSHQDDGLRGELRKHLRPLERGGLVDTWDDREIPAGAGWADEIDQRLESADIILLLVSADFINSEFCYGKEMKRAMERHQDKDDRAITIPIIVRTCDWHTAPFAECQALPRDGKPISDPHWKTADDYFEAVATGLRRRIMQPASGDAETASEPEAETRAPQWWKRAGVLPAVVIVALACAAAWWWMSFCSAMDREIEAGVSAMRQGRYGDARALLEKVSQRPIGGWRATPALEKAIVGVALEMEGRDISVERFDDGLARLRKEHPNDPDVLLFEGALAMRERPGAFEIEKFKEALERAPGFPEAHYYWGSVLIMQQRYPEALEHLDKAVALAPHAPHYLNARAFARRMDHDLDGAEADYRRSAEGGSILSRVELGEVLWCAGNFHEAAAQQQEALQELQANHAGPKGRNALPWTFATKPGESVTLNELREKICYARLSLLASQFVLGQAVKPEMRDCGLHQSEIATALARSLTQALDGPRLGDPLASRARQYLELLRAQPSPTE
jgi:tetratricopeptide (TPR) repeat protein